MNKFFLVFLLVVGFMFSQKKTQNDEIIYTNHKIGYGLTLPKTWKDFIVKNNIVYPPKTNLKSKDGYIPHVPILFFPIKQWEKWKKNGFKAYPENINTEPTEIGRNNKYIFIQESRWRNNFEGSEEIFLEIENILKSFKILNNEKISVHYSFNKDLMKNEWILANFTNKGNVENVKAKNLILKFSENTIHLRLCNSIHANFSLNEDNSKIVISNAIKTKMMCEDKKLMIAESSFLEGEYNIDITKGYLTIENKEYSYSFKIKK